MSEPAAPSRTGPSGTGRSTARRSSTNTSVRHGHYSGPVPRRRTLTQRIRDTLGFSVVAILVLFLILRVAGVRSTFSSFFLSVVITIALNVGLSYWNESSARRRAQQDRSYDDRGRRDADIRWREDDRR